MAATGIGFIGLGSIGARMLHHAASHPQVRAVAAWDPDAVRIRDGVAACPALNAARTVEELIARPDVDVVYVASPPLTHAGHARAAIAAGKPVLCEKPLGVDLAGSRALVAEAAGSGVLNAVNFIFASEPATQVHQAMVRGEAGVVQCVDIQLQARQWARRRYAAAPWLRHDRQGGVVREVLSHYVYLCQRLLGPLTLDHARVVHGNGPGEAETQVMAAMHAGPVPVRMVACTVGAGPDQFHCTLRGERAAWLFHDLYALSRSEDGPWQLQHSQGHPQGNPQGEPAAAWFRAQLDNIAAWASGGAHTMPDFAAACAVQEIIEGILAARGQTLWDPRATATPSRPSSPPDPLDVG
jgi:predicted dehydrogenase